MGFKRRKTYVATGWIPGKERTIPEMLTASDIDSDDMAHSIILQENDIENHGNKRRVRVTTTIEVEEI